jgi:DNA-binding NarL/FixJ family response regulator
LCPSLDERQRTEQTSHWVADPPLFVSIATRLLVINNGSVSFDLLMIRIALETFSGRRIIGSLCWTSSRKRTPNLAHLVGEMVDAVEVLCVDFSDRNPDKDCVVIADRFRLFADALAELLTAIGKSVQIVAEPAKGFETAVALNASALIVDVDAPSRKSVWETARVQATGSLVPFIAVSDGLDAATRRGLILAGCRGLVDRSTQFRYIAEVLQRIADGSALFVEDRTRSTLPVCRLRASMTPREKQVLEEIVKGSSTREIARALGLSEFTARTYVQRVLVKMGVHSRSQALVLARSHDAMRFAGAEVDPKRAG